MATSMDGIGESKNSKDLESDPFVPDPSVLEAGSVHLPTGDAEAATGRDDSRSSELRSAPFEWEPKSVEDESGKDCREETPLDGASASDEDGKDGMDQQPGAVPTVDEQPGEDGRGWIRRKRNRDGPPCRKPPKDEIGAIERALGAAVEGRKGDVFKPSVGMVFNSENEAYEFYNAYSWEMGFGIKHGNKYINRKTRYKSKQDLLCSCEMGDDIDQARMMLFYEVLGT